MAGGVTAVGAMEVGATAEEAADTAEPLIRAVRFRVWLPIESSQDHESGAGRSLIRAVTALPPAAPFAEPEARPHLASPAAKAATGLAHLDPRYPLPRFRPPECRGPPYNLRPDCEKRNRATTSPHAPPDRPQPFRPDQSG